MIKKIAVMTGARSDYGLLYWLLKSLKASPDFELQTIASSMHLSPEFGLTYRQIEQDGFEIDAKVDCLLANDDSAVGMAKSLGIAVDGFAECLNRLKPDAVVILGDRFEALAAAQAAFILKIPIIHLHGGELTLGALDDGFRHCITKMAHLHCVSTHAYQQRVIQLGERPESVHWVGAMVLDSIRQLKLYSQKTLEDILGIKLQKPIFVVTYHPETRCKIPSTKAMAELFEALGQYPAAQLIFTKSNADQDGSRINQMIDDFCHHAPKRAKSFTSLGFRNYLSLLNIADMVIGNSSSGIIEAPYFGIPTINIGNRQQGRIHPPSVICCQANHQSIKKAIDKGLTDEFKSTLNHQPLPYGQGSPAEKIIEILKQTDLAQLGQKHFYDQPMKETVDA